MKKALSLVILLVILFMSYQLIGTFIKKNHEIEYNIQIENQEYKIKEIYNKKLNNSYYLEITLNDQKFIYNIDNSFNKQKRIVKDIKVKNIDNVLCIYPILINDQKTEIECNYNNNLYSYYVAKDFTAAKELVTELKTLGYDSKVWNPTSNENIKTHTSYLYNNNFLDNDVFVIWNYKGIELINKEKTEYLSLYSYDKYENTHATIVDNYFITPQYNYGTVFDFNKLNLINLDDFSKSSIDLEQTVKQDTYINGIIDNKLYYFDPDNLKQIEINPKRKKYKIVGNEKDNAQYYANGEWSTINIYDFKTNKKYFNDDYSNNEKLMIYNPKNIYETKINYYYLLEDGSFYQLNKNNLDKPMLLFKQDNMKEIKVIDNTIYYMVGDSIYLYNNETGIQKVLQNSEWNYNYTNIYNVYKKSK